MQIKTLQGGLKKATIEMILLNLLAESDKYGYQLSQECKRRSDGQYSILEGSMYPILYRLEESGYINSYEKKVGKRLSRVYYHLEEAGYKHLMHLREEYEDYIKVIDNLLSFKGETDGQ